MRPFRIVWRPTRGYWPSAPVTGEAADYIYRGLNLIPRGGRDYTYLEQWQGYTSKDAAGGIVAITGTVSTTSGSATITGSGTKFIAELSMWQPLIIGARVYVVTSVVSDTSATIDPVAVATASGQTAYYSKQIQEVDNFRASFLRGSIIRLPQGNLLSVGLGEVRLDGSPVPGSGLTLTPTPQISIYNNGTGNYTHYKLGMQTPTSGFSVAATGGGTKNMLAGTYSIRIAPAKIETGGWNNATEPQSVTLTAGQRANVTFPAMDTSAGQNAWRVYVTLYSTDASIVGPWYFYDTVTTSQVASGGATYAIEWRDAEVSQNDILEFDYNPPPTASFIAAIGGLPVLLGTDGPGRILTGTAATTSGSATITGTSTSFTTELSLGRFVWINNLIYRVLTIASNTSMTVTPTPNATGSGFTIRSSGEAPGPVIRPAKPYLGGVNIEAFPAISAVALNPPETILGYVEGMGRLYLMTANRLHMVALSGDPIIPVAVRPFWKTGFRNQRAVCFVNGEIYGFTTNGATRSGADGDEITEQHEFAAPVASDMRNWNPSRVSVAYDPVNEAVVYIHADDGLRPGGTKRYSTALMYMLRLGVWSTPIRIEDPSDGNDGWATSAMTAGGAMYILVSNLSFSSIFSWDVTGTVGEVYAATPFMDADAEEMDKATRGISFTGHGISSIVLQIYGGSVNSDVPVSDLAAGTNSQSGNITYTPGSSTRIFARTKLNCRQQRVFAARVQLATNGGNGGCRLDEAVIDGTVMEVKY